MLHNLKLKYFISLLVVLLTLFFALNTYGSQQLKDSITYEKKVALYQQSDHLSKQYAQPYFNYEVTLDELKKQLTSIDALINTRIWFIRRDGTLLIDSKKIWNSDINVYDIDRDMLSTNTREHIQYPGYIDAPQIMVVSNVIMNYKVEGFIVMFFPESSLLEDTFSITNVLNIILLIFALCMIFLYAIFIIITVIPMKRLIKAAKEYSDGHYDYQLKLYSHDEFYQLGQALLYMSKELNSLEDYQKKFVANISHDFRSPLTSIKGYVEAIIDGTIPYEVQNKYLDIILFETERLNKLTNNLLTLNSYERNGALLHIVSFDINALIKRIVMTFEGTCKKKKLIIKLDFSEKQEYVDGDIDKIQQVLYNLIDNAIKFSHNNSNIRIATSEKNEKVFIAVKDYGIGIPKDSIQKIWERFYKTDTSRGKDKKGTGLGLSITKEIINAHNQNINVISTEGVGTEFIFTLPHSEE